MFHDDIELREKFLFTLEWLLAVTRRYSGHVQFGLIHINFANAGVLGDTYGAQGAAEKLHETQSVLHHAFRKTDLVARDGADFWVLTPFTANDGKLADKAREMVEIASRGGLELLERDISLFALPFASEGMDPNCSASDFLAYLKKNHIRLASQEVVIPPAQ